MSDDPSLREARDRLLQHRLLSHEEEIELGKRMAEGDATAREALVTHNMRLVFTVARRYFSRDPAQSFDDLVQEGMLGLMRAVDKYDWTRGTRFSTYALWWIRQAIGRAIENSGQIRISVHATRGETRMSPCALEQARAVLELDAPVWGRDNLEKATVGELTPSGADTEAEAVQRLLVAQALGGVTAMQQEALVMMMQGVTRREIGARLGMSHGYAWFAVLQARKALGIAQV